MTTDSANDTPHGFAPGAYVGFEDFVGPLYARTAQPHGTIMGFRVAREHVNGRNSCHGGMLVAFADMAWGKPLAGRGYDGGWATVRLTTDFLAPADLGDWLEASSVILGRDGDLFTLQGEVRKGDVRIMVGTAVYKGVRSRP